LICLHDAAETQYQQVFSFFSTVQQDQPQPILTYLHNICSAQLTMAISYNAETLLAASDCKYLTQI